ADGARLMEVEVDGRAEGTKAQGAAALRRRIRPDGCVLRGGTIGRPQPRGEDRAGAGGARARKEGPTVDARGPLRIVPGIAHRPPLSRESQDHSRSPRTVLSRAAARVRPSRVCDNRAPREGQRPDADDTPDAAAPDAD